MSLECHPFALLDAITSETDSLLYRMTDRQLRGILKRVFAQRGVGSGEWGVGIVGNDMADD
jgi:hypothetical protein